VKVTTHAPPRRSRFARGHVRTNRRSEYDSRWRFGGSAGPHRPRTPMTLLSEHLPTYRYALTPAPLAWVVCTVRVLSHFGSAAYLTRTTYRMPSPSQSS